MKDIICPHCNTAFQVDDKTYASILEQVRGKEFNEEVSRRIHEIEEQQKIREEAVKSRMETEREKELSKKNEEINSLKTDILNLQHEIKGFETRKSSELKELEAKKTQELFEKLEEGNKRISELEQELEKKDSEYKISILKAQSAEKEELQNKEKEIVELQSKLNSEKLSAENRENQLKEYHKQQLADKQSEIDRLKDFKLRLSSKMMGETLEQHCSIQFAQAQSMGQYPDAVFEKDTIAVEGTKGDFIFRDFIDGQEYISVMFEMKNEFDATVTKHKNDDFLDKLDKDRNKKNCEYAVLVSMLELDNPLYDAGIVDKGFRYPKMMVIRPQFFMPVLRMLTEGARRGFMEKKDLVLALQEAKSESIELTNFKNKIEKVQNMLRGQYDGAHKKFVAATEGIDKAILGLEKQIKILKDIKQSFESADTKMLKMADIGTEELTLKKLTHGSPSVRKKIEGEGK